GDRHIDQEHSAPPEVLEHDTAQHRAADHADHRRVYNAVESYRDLETPLIGAVERLIDFVTEQE
ncbi:DUF3097 family protein, partial [Nocardia sp. NPDC004722]